MNEREKKQIKRTLHEAYYFAAHTYACVPPRGSTYQTPRRKQRHYCITTVFSLLGDKFNIDFNIYQPRTTYPVSAVHVPPVPGLDGAPRDGAISARAEADSAVTNRHVARIGRVQCVNRGIRKQNRNRNAPPTERAHVPIPSW